MDAIGKALMKLPTDGGRYNAFHVFLFFLFGGVPLAVVANIVASIANPDWQETQKGIMELLPSDLIPQENMYAILGPAYLVLVIAIICSASVAIKHVREDNAAATLDDNLLQQLGELRQSLSSALRHEASKNGWKVVNVGGSIADEEAVGSGHSELKAYQGDTEKAFSNALINDLTGVVNAQGGSSLSKSSAVRSEVLSRRRRRGSDNNLAL
jgi:hypothetical protein